MPFHCPRCNREIDRSFKACPHCGEPVTDFLREYADKPIDGKYRIVSRLGAGGMGEVYKVEHTFLGATRVIKVVRPQIAGSDEAHDRFLREARLATKIHHPNVATLHDFAALPDGSHYMVWEFIEGENLAQVMRRCGVLPARQAVEIARQALSGLDAIHRAGIVHRDISPENLMITREADGSDRVKIIDLGVAKGEDTDGGAMTKTGIFVGKLRYCSPEHLGFLPEGQKIDGRADLYSLAIVLVEMLTGRPPFEATSPHQYILHHSRDTELKAVDLARVPAALQPILTRALERDRNKRYLIAREFAEALERAETPAPAEADATLRLTPPPDVVTERTPLPPVRTEIDAAPAPPPRLPARASPPAPRSAAPLLTGVIVFLLAVIAVGAYLALRKPTAPAPVAQTITTTQPVAPQHVPQPHATVDVTATESSLIGTVTAPPMQIAAPAPQPAKPQPQRVEKSETTPPVATATHEEPPVPMNFPMYTEGGASTANESTMAEAQMQLRGVKQVSLSGTGDPVLTKELSDLLRDNGLTVIDGADVVIRFDGKVERVHLGRKRRSADATITRHGRPVFHYVMPPEEYRVGDNPAEAFARILNDLFGR